MSANSTIWSNFRLVSASDMPRIAALRKTLSRPVSCGWKPAPVAMSPAIRPRVSTWPASGFITPLISLSRLLLPEPLRHIRPSDSPASISNETSLTARNVSLICWRRRAAMVICLMVRWYRIVNSLLALRARIDVLISEALRELSLEAGEGPLAHHQDDGRDPEHQEPEAEEVVGQVGVSQLARVAVGQARVLRGAGRDRRDPEAPLDQQDAHGQRVGHVEVVEVAVPHAAGGELRERVDHRDDPVREQLERRHDVLEVLEEHVHRGEQQRQGGAEDREHGEAEQPRGDALPLRPPPDRDGADEQDQQLRERVDRGDDH